MTAPTQEPALTKKHLALLRQYFSKGRPVHLTLLSAIDLDLMAQELIKSVPSSYGAAVIEITKKGIDTLSSVRQQTIENQKPHHTLANRLSKHLQEKGLLTWENIELSNPAPLKSRTWGLVRPDVFSCKPSLHVRNAASVIYEVKISRADFLADMAKPEKRQAYLELAGALYYCCPKGLILPDEIPSPIGLMYEDTPGIFSIVKNKRSARGFTMHVDTVMTLMVKKQQQSC